MDDVIAEAERLPRASIDFARGVLFVKPPDDLSPLVDRVRIEHPGALAAAHQAIDKRFGETGADEDYVNVYYAASELAVIEHAYRDELSSEDRDRLRELWNVLLAQN